jgi:hypothetical protein
VAVDPSRHIVHYINIVHPIIHPTVPVVQLLVSSTKTMELVNYPDNSKAGKCCSQLARIDYINPKRWTAWRRRFEKSPLIVSLPFLWTLPLHLEWWNLPFLMELGDFIFKMFWGGGIRVHHHLHINRSDFCLMQKWMY